MTKLTDIDSEQTVTLSLKSLAFLYALVAAKSCGAEDELTIECATMDWENYLLAAHSTTVEYGDWLYDYVDQLVTDEELEAAYQETGV